MRLKEDFSTDLDRYVDMLDLIEPTTFMRKDDDSSVGRKRHVGYVAQKVKKAMGDVGLEESDFAGFSKVMQEDGPVYSYSLCYEEFIPILHAKIKKLEKRIEELEKRNKEQAAVIESIKQQYEELMQTAIQYRNAYFSIE